MANYREIRGRSLAARLALLFTVAFDLNYRGILGSCLPVQLAFRIDVL
ncbi:MAG: hypothetical protein ACREPJ_10130 [Rhodanobacteraceae bacterium]